MDEKEKAKKAMCDMIDSLLLLAPVAVQFVHLPGVGNYQKAGEVVLVGLDALLQHLHAVAFGCSFGADGGMAFQLFALDDFGTQCRVFAFHYFDLGVLAEEFAALHQGDGVGVDFGDVVPVFFGQADEAVRDAQLVFTYDLCAALPQQFVVVHLQW